MEFGTRFPEHAVRVPANCGSRRVLWFLDYVLHIFTLRDKATATEDMIIFIITIVRVSDSKHSVTAHLPH